MRAKIRIGITRYKLRPIKRTKKQLFVCTGVRKFYF